MSHSVEGQASKEFGVPVHFVGEDVSLRSGGVTCGDVDVLFKGEREDGSTLHVLLERKRRVGVLRGGNVVAQVLRTREAYLEVMGVPSTDKVECVLFAEAMEPGMVETALKEGIYVLLDSMELKKPR